MGMITTQFIDGPKALHLIAPSPNPMENVMGMHMWGGSTYGRNNTFRDWDLFTRYGYINRAIQISPFGSDQIPFHDFYDTKFINVTEGAMSHMYDPPQKWAIIKDCGEFPCTGPKNFIMDFSNTQFLGPKKPLIATPSFQIVPNNTGVLPFVKDCTP